MWAFESSQSESIAIAKQIASCVKEFIKHKRSKQVNRAIGKPLLAGLMPSSPQRTSRTPERDRVNKDMGGDQLKKQDSEMQTELKPQGTIDATSKEPTHLLPNPPSRSPEQKLQLQPEPEPEPESEAELDSASELLLEASGTELSSHSEYSHSEYSNQSDVDYSDDSSAAKNYGGFSDESDRHSHSGVEYFDDSGVEEIIREFSDENDVDYGHSSSGDELYDNTAAETGSNDDDGHNAVTNDRVDGQGVQQRLFTSSTEQDQILSMTAPGRVEKKQQAAVVAAVSSYSCHLLGPLDNNDKVPHCHQFH